MEFVFQARLPLSFGLPSNQGYLFLSIHRIIGCSRFCLAIFVNSFKESVASSGTQKSEKSCHLCHLWQGSVWDEVISWFFSSGGMAVWTTFLSQRCYSCEFAEHLRPVAWPMPLPTTTTDWWKLSLRTAILCIYAISIYILYLDVCIFLFYRQEIIDHDRPQNVLAGHALKRRSQSEESAFAGGEPHCRWKANL